MTAKIPEKELLDLIFYQPTIAEVALHFKVSVPTIQKRVRDNYEMDWKQFLYYYGSSGRLSARKKYWWLALKKDNIVALRTINSQYNGISEKQFMDVIISSTDAVKKAAKAIEKCSEEDAARYYMDNLSGAPDEPSD